MTLKLGTTYHRCHGDAILVEVKLCDGARCFFFKYSNPTKQFEANLKSLKRMRLTCTICTR